MDIDEPFERSFGKIGEAVPEVDADDIRTVARESREVAKAHPGCAIGMDLLASLCKPGADIQAVCYRHMSISVLGMIAQMTGPADDVMSEVRNKLAVIIRDGELIDSAYTAAAKIPMVWTRQGLPFDLEEFLKMCA